MVFKNQWEYLKAEINTKTLQHGQWNIGGTKTDIRFQLFPSHMHHHNDLKREVQILKIHFIYDLCTLEPNFPFYIWYCLLPQVSMKFNMLQQYWFNSELSSYNSFEDMYNYEQVPLASLGCKFQIDKKKSVTHIRSPLSGWMLFRT